MNAYLDIWASAIETRSTAGRGSSNKLNLYGIKKLRELILELAVRGQLVPQDPTDEPASVLLEKIATEKARLIKAGKLKKQAALPPIADDEKPFELPEGWEWVTLSQLGVFSGGKTPSKMKSEYWDGNIPWITPKDMKLATIYDSEDHVTLLAIDDGLSVVEPDSLLFVVRSGILRRTFPVAITKVESTVNQDLKVLNLFDKSIVSYLLLMMQGFEQYILQNLSKTGTTVESIKFDEFSTHYFILPPEAEQHRIVAKVNELMFLCDALEQAQESSINDHQRLVENLLAELTKTPSPQPLSRQAGEGLRKEEADTSCSPSPAQRERGLGGEGLPWQRIAAHFDTLFTTEHSIDQLKQTILQLAVMGKLVPQDPTDEPASVLLAKIAAEKARLVKAGKLKKEKPLPPIAEDEKPFELPPGWEWCRFGSLFISFSNGLYKPAKFYTDQGVPSLRMYNIQNGKIDFHDIRRVELSNDEVAQFKLEEGDLLINRVNSKELVGKTAIIPNYCEPLVFESMNMRAKPVTGLSCSSYLNLLMQSSVARETISVFAKEAIGQASINQSQVSSLQIPVPPLAEQQRIVAKVDELMTLCDQLKARIGDAQTTQLHLADALAEITV
ncbi:restriction endonuclease subunit S [Thiothrix nivea]|uniref:Restriction modification system DNA specificity domain-containing protein n=1 Tax=Thiothrix nivea (strain ATCC 35100 / DSM 5205 / JP2) TaxID=870187 RepID=A0A656HJJ1_THINJ|nr:restriction endonuclease subunit S [Thiothrix nivea]EIJ35409.1 restriction modification system DNA specificity domain-containing protein [Thiothrix nivea DSM 5205]